MTNLQELRKEIIILANKIQIIKNLFLLEGIENREIDEIERKYTMDYINQLKLAYNSLKEKHEYLMAKAIEAKNEKIKKAKIKNEIEKIIFRIV